MKFDPHRGSAEEETAVVSLASLMLLSPLVVIKSSKGSDPGPCFWPSWNHSGETLGLKPCTGPLGVFTNKHWDGSRKVLRPDESPSPSVRQPHSRSVRLQFKVLLPQPENK